jgi:hypothetical protein
MLQCVCTGCGVWCVHAATWAISPWNLGDLGSEESDVKHVAVTYSVSGMLPLSALAVEAGILCWCTMLGDGRMSVRLLQQLRPLF